MSLPDNRMRFPAGEIDFTNDVGETGQDHDNYPQAGGQPRYDWMRMSIISLLTQQSSYDEPTQYREGTPWFDLNEMALKIRRNGEWVPYAQAILISEGYTLADLYDEFRSLNRVNTQFNGTATSTADHIALPGEVQDLIDGAQDLTADVFINGKLIDPSNISISSSQVNLSGGITVNSGDTYVVTIKNVIASNHPNQASEILSMLLTVDGTGSGLDADKLDGQEGNYYATQSDVDAHTSASNPHSDSASDTDLDAHTSASNPHSDSASDTDLDAHTSASNPHSDSASDTDLDAHTSASNPHSDSASDTDLSAHTSDTDNPHSVTFEDLTLALRSITTATTLADTDGLILAGGTSDYTISLPAASTVTNRVFYIKKTSTESYALTIDGSGSETIDGELTIELVSQYDTLTLTSDGSNWHII